MAAKKSPKPSHGGLVTSPPASILKTLRLLEAAYCKAMDKIEKLEADLMVEKQKNKGK